MKNPDLEEPVGQPAALKPRARSVSREPNAKAKAKAEAKEAATAKKVEKEEMENAKYKQQKIGKTKQHY